MRPLVIALVLVVAAHAARADDRREEAKRDVDAAITAQALGKYDDAIALYKKAYDAVPHAEILFDLGQAYRLKGDAEIAIDYYQRYLSVEPNGRVSKEAARWTGELEKQIAARKADSAKPPPVDDTHKPAPEPPKPPEPKPAPPPPAPPVVSVTATTAPEPTRGVRILPWALSGAALVAGGVALGLDLSANSTYADAVKEPDPDRQTSLWHSANTKRYAADGFAIAGVGCAAVAVWAFLQHGDEPSSVATLQPIAGATHIGIAWGTVW